MLPQAQNPQLQKLIETHITQTEAQIKTLEQAFAAVGSEPQRVKCVAAAGIVTENRKTLKEVSSNPSLVDLAIAGGSSKVEHYEVSSYRALVQIAEGTGQAKAAKLLQRNLAQEEQTATKVEASMPKLLQQAIKSAQTQGASVGVNKAAAGAKVAAKSTGAKNAASTKSAAKKSNSGGVLQGATTTGSASDGASSSGDT